MKILLTTLHAKYVHASLALPCLAAACGELAGGAVRSREFTVNEPAEQVLRSIVGEEADVVMFSCYIWNVTQTLRLIADLKLIRPRTFVVLGGPEVSYGAFELLADNPAVDCIVRGEGETTCRELLAALTLDTTTAPQLDTIAGITFRNGEHITATPDRQPIADLDVIPSPFAAGLVDLGKPLVYYETSRGCPFSCAFCMSSLEGGVRSFSLDRIKSDLHILLASGVQTVKLVDRTFNFAAARANEIWAFILEHNQGSRFHFEIAADLLTDANLRLLAKVPAGLFRFEIGVQAGEAATLARVARQSNLPALFANVERLRQETGVTLHLDLVAGLPGEDFAGFTASLQRLLDARPHHIQVEPLKVLKGAPMRAIARQEDYAFSAAPPYKILQTPWLSFTEIGRIDTIGRLLDLIYNSSRFTTALAVLAETAPLATLFVTAGRFWEEHGLASTLPLTGLFAALWDFGKSLLAETALEPFRDALAYDYCLTDYPAAGKVPEFFKGDGDATGGEKPAGMTKELAQTLGICAGSKIRTFSRYFLRDYRTSPWGAVGRELMFVYISSPGRGLEVRVLNGR
jgi:anaerobic magnesium-protoporphyrin IX monomethyl ester cyclase